MNKKIIALMVIVGIIVIGVGIYWLQNQETANQDTPIQENNDEEENSVDENNSSIAIVYFSATGNTKQVAEYIEEATGGTLFEIVPEEEYTQEDLNYSNDDSRASLEQNDPDARPEIANTIDLTSYEVIYFGYPIWWGDVPKIMLSFLDENDLSGKTLIPFCTSGSSSITTSIGTLKEYRPNINWIDGARLTPSQSEVTDWINGLDI